MRTRALTAAVVRGWKVAEYQIDGHPREWRKTTLGGNNDRLEQLQTRSTHYERACGVCSRRLLGNRTSTLQQEHKRGMNS